MNMKVDTETGMMAGELANIYIKHIALRKVRFGLSSLVGKQALDDMRMEVYMDYLTNQIVVAFSSVLLGRETMKTVIDTVRYPATWRDAFKERWFPKFLKRRFPVKYEEKNIEVHIWNICPHLNIASPRGHDVHLSFLAQGLHRGMDDES